VKVTKWRTSTNVIRFVRREGFHGICGDAASGSLWSDTSTFGYKTPPLMRLTGSRSSDNSSNSFWFRNN